MSIADFSGCDEDDILGADKDSEYEEEAADHSILLANQRRRLHRPFIPSLGIRCERVSGLRNFGAGGDPGLRNCLGTHGHHWS